MDFSTHHNIASTLASAALSLFTAGSPEAHAIISLPEGTRLPAEAQIDHLRHAAEALTASLDRQYRLRPVMARWLLSDPANQAAMVKGIPSGAAVSIVGQAPLNATKAALWLYFIETMEVTDGASGLVSARRPDYTHIFAASHNIPGFCSKTATAAMLQDLNIALEEMGSSLAEGCLRTWFFVRDIDFHYRGVVNGRNEVFDAAGLTPETHFIASTGIGACAESPEITVKMDAWAALGVSPDQVAYIQAPEHLNPTYQYGVAFERATAIDYGDRRHLLVSGTASIDNRGNIVAPGDIEGQTLRMLENVEALLARGEMEWTDVAHAIIYLRDSADYQVVKSIFDERFPETSSAPRVFVHAPVCRPGWLIEMECMAVKAVDRPGYAPF